MKSAPDPVQLDAVPLKIKGVGQLARRKDGSVTWTAVNGDETTLSFDDDRLLFHYAADPGRPRPRAWCMSITTSPSSARA